MRALTRLLATLALLGAAVAAQAQESAADQAKVQQFLASLHYKSGVVPIASAHATLKLGDDFRYLDAADAQRVLTDLWGNPPDSDVLGMLVPAGASLVDENDSWVVVISHSDDGYVSDSDASTIDYTKMLKEMQDGAREANPQREKQGYPALQIVGWATPPHYDSGTNKLYWAKEISFAGAREHTLNYDIRVLGRGGYLSFNAVAGMHQLEMVKARMPHVLDMAEYDAGQRYADFDSKTDKVAAYGIGALVAGAIAAKAGLFAKLLALLIAAKKFIVVGVLALAAAVRKLFARRA